MNTQARKMNTQTGNPPQNNPLKQRDLSLRIRSLSAIVLLLAFSLLMTGCGSGEDAAAPDEKPEVMVLAAASLTDALDEIITEFEKDSDCTITPSYAGSGDLVQQIEGGAPCDIFISASKSNMDQLEEGGYIDTETRQDMLANTLTLISTIEKKDAVTMDTLTSGDITTIAVGEPETVPAGKYATQALDNMAITDELTDKIVYAKDVRAVLNYVETGNADCGFVYRTDALMMDSEKGAIIGDVDSNLHDPIVYPAAILSEAPCLLEGGASAECLMEFYEFLQEDFANSVFEKYGFTIK